MHANCVDRAVLDRPVENVLMGGLPDVESPENVRPQQFFKRTFIRIGAHVSDQIRIFQRAQDSAPNPHGIIAFLFAGFAIVQTLGDFPFC